MQWKTESLPWKREIERVDKKDWEWRGEKSAEIGGRRFLVEILLGVDVEIRDSVDDIVFNVFNNLLFLFYKLCGFIIRYIN